MKDNNINLEESFNVLVEDVISIIENSKNNVYQNIVIESTKSYYLIGELIVNNELNGDSRAEYGKSILKNLSFYLQNKYTKGYSVTNLQDYRKFYLIWSKQRTVSVKSKLEFRLSFSHYQELHKLNIRQIEFYEKLAIEQGLSTRELKRVINSQTYERITTSGKKNTLTSKNQFINHKFDELYKDPYVLEFLNLPDLVNGEENKLENAIIDNLHSFLLELGKGFAFVARQYRFNLEGDNFYIDLVFYNIPLKCFVIIELKTTKATHSNIGQLQMYVNYFDRNVKDENDNKTIGILLCSSKNDKLVEFSLPEDNSQIYASKYELFLPNKQQLEKIINDTNKLK